MEMSDLRKLATEELEQKSKETRAELFNARVKHATGQLETTAKLRFLRRDIARLETLLREKSEAAK